MKGVIQVKEKRPPKFSNVIRYLDKACNNSLLTEENLCSHTTEFRFEQNYFRYKGVSVEYSDDITYIRYDRVTYVVIRKEDCKYRNCAYLMEIAMKFERSMIEWESGNVLKQ